MNDATATAPITPITGEALAERAAAVREEVSKAFIGQPEVLDQILIALLAGGHVLIEGVPGLGKTLLVRALAQALELNYARVQFTSDLMPSDVSGHAVYDPKTESFKIRRGPVFTNLLLADEINRAPAKTQSALLEVMQEGQVTIEGKPFELSPPFLTLATQNPVDQEGTYPLPEAQLDRFLLKILIDYPALADEKRMVDAITTGRSAGDFDLSKVQRVLGGCASRSRRCGPTGDAPSNPADPRGCRVRAHPPRSRSERRGQPTAWSPTPARTDARRRRARPAHRTDPTTAAAAFGTGQSAIASRADIRQEPNSSSMPRRSRPRVGRRCRSTRRAPGPREPGPAARRAGRRARAGRPRRVRLPRRAPRGFSVRSSRADRRSSAATRPSCSSAGEKCVGCAQLTMK